MERSSQVGGSWRVIVCERRSKLLARAVNGNLLHAICENKSTSSASLSPR